MKSYGGFEANAQNIRIFTKLESKSDKYQGLNLTRAVIDGQMKYKDIFSANKKKFVYADDVELADWASEEARSAVEGCGNKSRSFECEIMDWADEVAYAVHDLEDSIHAGYVSASTFQDSDRIDDIVNRVTEKFKDCDVSVSEVWTELRNSLRKNNPDFQPFSNVSSLYEKKSNRKQLTSYLISRYIKATCRVKRDNVRNSRISERYMYTVSIPVEYKVEVALIIKLVMKFVIESPQVYTLEEKARHIVRCLFLKFMRDDNTKYLLPDDWKEHLRQVDSNEDKARVVSDYIAGMTDSYAQKTYARLFLPNQGSIYDLL